MSVWIHHFTTGLGNSSNRNGCHKNSWSLKTCIYGWLFLGPTPGCTIHIADIIIIGAVSDTEYR